MAAPGTRTWKGSARDGEVQRVLWVEAAANGAIVVAKTGVGIATGSAAVLGDAVHSLADLANNAVALVATRVASAPPDREHPYGHRKFETLAVFALATLLAVLALELAIRSVTGGPREVVAHGWSLAVMLGVLGANTALAIWENRWARRLRSDILHADASHTASDVLTTVVVIASWQFAASGHAWLDTVATLVVAGLILYLAYRLFQRAIPVLVDESIADPEELATVVSAIAGVRSTRRVRSHGFGADGKIDVVVTVDPGLSTQESHAIADEIERELAAKYAARDITIHVEPHADLGG